MNLTSSKNPLTVGLLLAAAILVLVIALEWLLAGNSSPADLDGSGTEDISLPAPSDYNYSAPRIDDYPEVLERPVFFRDRTLPPEPEPELVTTAPLQPLRLRLEGVAISSESRVAVLRNTASNQLLNLAEGTSHDGWMLEKVSADSALFRRGSQTSELLLDDGRTN